MHLCLNVIQVIIFHVVIFDYQPELHLGNSYKNI